jgi:hypothetical protein
LSASGSRGVRSGAEYRSCPGTHFGAGAIFDYKTKITRAPDAPEQLTFMIL